MAQCRKFQICLTILFLHSVQSALVGELPSFGMATESKFQHLMHRNTSGDPPQLHPPQSAADVSVFNNFDTNLSVEAKAFRPNQGQFYALSKIDAHHHAHFVHLALMKSQTSKN